MRIISRMNVGGPAVQVTGLMRGINSNQFDQRLYTGFCAADESDYLETVAHDVVPMRIPDFGRSLSLGRDVKVLLMVIREIRKFKPHVIHTHTSKAGFLGRVASVISLHPAIRVHTFHGHLLNGYFGPLKRFLIISAEKMLAHFTHQLLAVGEKVKQDLLDVGIGNPEKFEVMPPGFQIGQIPPKKESKRYFGMFSSKLQCAFIGRLTQIKRPDRFLDVVSELKARKIDIEFFMAGDGEQWEKCWERVVREQLPVKFLGWQSDIEKVLAAADMVILTSDNEGMPLSLIQAGMAGLPAVTIHVGSTSEVVLNNVTGLLTSSAVTEIADAVEKLARNRDLRAQLGAAARSFTLANFGVQRLVNDHENLYKRLIANQAKF